MVIFTVNVTQRLLVQGLVVILEIFAMQVVAASPVAPPMACFVCAVLVRRLALSRESLSGVHMAKSAIISSTAVSKITELEADSHSVRSRRRVPCGGWGQARIRNFTC